MDEDKKPRFIHMPNTNVMDKSAIDAAYYKKQVPDSRVIYSKVMAINSQKAAKLTQIAPKTQESQYRTSYYGSRNRKPTRCFLL